MSRKPVPVLRREMEASQLLRQGDDKQKLPIAVLEIPPLDQTHISLGEYTREHPPIGFSIEVSPDYEPDDIVAQITRLEAAFDVYELILHVANYRDNSVSVEVFRLLGKGSPVANTNK
jgi:hypothetical protein